MAKTRTFTYEIPDSDRVIVAPYFEDAMNAGFLRKHRHDSEIEQMFALVESALSPEALDAFDELPLSKMNAFYTAWQTDAGITAGGMIGLLDLHDEFPEALEYELLTVGLRWRDLGSKRFSWRDLKVVVAEAPIDGALTRSRYPDAFAHADRRLEVLDWRLAVANTQRGNQSGAKKGDFPELPAWARQAETRIGSNPIPIDELAEWLGGPFLNPYS